MGQKSNIESVMEIIAQAQAIFRQKLEKLRADGGITREQYIRYLTMQHYLTKGVQRHFMIAASHPDLEGRQSLRDFLFRFALEEEPHYRMAEKDLKRLGTEPLPCPLDVKLWWAYFDSIITERPFVRLGATCILENLGGAGSGDVVKELFAQSSFINEANSTFLLLHLHEVLPHGDQILRALTSVRLSEQDLADLEEGARTGAVLYLRMADWALGESELLDMFRTPEASIRA